MDEGLVERFGVGMGAGTYAACVDEGVLEVCIAGEELLAEKVCVFEVGEEAGVDGVGWWEVR